MRSDTDNMIEELFKNTIDSLLPPAYKVRGKVLFSQVPLCSHFGVGVGTPSQVQVGGGYSIELIGEYPIPGPGRGLPHPRSGGGDTPPQVQVGGTPS